MLSGGCAPLVPESVLHRSHNHLGKLKEILWDICFSQTHMSKTIGCTPFQTKRSLRFPCATFHCAVLAVSAWTLAGYWRHYMWWPIWHRMLVET